MSEIFFVKSRRENPGDRALWVNPCGISRFRSEELAENSRSAPKAYCAVMPFHRVTGGDRLMRVRQTGAEELSFPAARSGRKVPGKRETGR